MIIGKHIYSDTITRTLGLVAGLIVVGLWSLTAVIAQRADDVTPLHYTIYFGIDWSGSTTWLWWLPTFGTVSWVSHLLISGRSEVVDWSRAWMTINLLIEFLLLAALGALFFAFR